MHFLNGDRIYIKPESYCKSVDEQTQNCLQQLTNIKPEQKLFKLNFFAETNSKYEYIALLQKLEVEISKYFSGPVLLSLLAQPPITHKIIVEACFYDPNVWDLEVFGNCTCGAILFKKNDSSVLIGNVQSYKFPTCKLNSDEAFSELINVFNDAGFPLNSIVRQWNYIENILGDNNGRQHYQEFNNVRSGVYGNTFGKKGYPAATGIGMNQGGIILEFIAIKSLELVSKPIDNPLQVSAHHYTKDVLAGENCMEIEAPKFERARFLELFNKKLVLISGTASILGERTTAVGDPGEQTKITVENIKQLYSPKTLNSLTGNSMVPKYGHARVYVKNRKDYSTIKRTFKLYYGNLPVVYIVADICREDLLVEIEGRVILE